MPSSHRLCPYCLTAVIGTVVALILPELATVPTPFGKASLLLIWIPSVSALLRQGMLRIAGRAQPALVSEPHYR